MKTVSLTSLQLSSFETLLVILFASIANGLLQMQINSQNNQKLACKSLLGLPLFLSPHPLGILSPFLFSRSSKQEFCIYISILKQVKEFCIYISNFCLLLLISSQNLILIRLPKPPISPCRFEFY